MEKLKFVMYVVLSHSSASSSTHSPDLVWRALSASLPATNAVGDFDDRNDLDVFLSSCDGYWNPCRETFVSCSPTWRTGVVDCVWSTNLDRNVWRTVPADEKHEKLPRKTCEVPVTIDRSNLLFEWTTSLFVWVTSLWCSSSWLCCSSSSIDCFAIVGTAKEREREYALAQLLEHSITVG